MTEEKKYTTTTTTTTIETQTPKVQDAAEGLTPTEEKAIRMLHGLTEEKSQTLQFALGANETSLAQLAMMESQLLDLFGRNEKIDATHVDAKARIIDALKG